MKNLRVYIDKDKHDIYERLVKRGAENPDDYPFHTMKDLFILAACLGAKYNSYIPIQSSKDIFHSEVFDEKTDIPIMAALAFKREQSLNILTNERSMLDLVEEYANGGIAFVQQEIVNNPGRPLNNFVSLIISN